MQWKKVRRAFLRRCLQHSEKPIGFEPLSSAAAAKAGRRFARFAARSKACPDTSRLFRLQHGLDGQLSLGARDEGVSTQEKAQGFIGSFGDTDSRADADAAG